MCPSISCSAAPRDGRWASPNTSPFGCGRTPIPGRAPRWRSPGTARRCAISTGPRCSRARWGWARCRRISSWCARCERRSARSAFCGSMPTWPGRCPLRGRRCASSPPTTSPTSRIPSTAFARWPSFERTARSRSPVIWPTCDWRPSSACPTRSSMNVLNVGGIRETVKFIAACEAFGVGFWFYSGDGAIGTAALPPDLGGARLPRAPAPVAPAVVHGRHVVVEAARCSPEFNVLPVPDGTGARGRAGSPPGARAVPSDAASRPTA